ncbi:MAG TPA: hypothetical protein VIE65_06995 [Methylobacter sp.]|jgi:transposase-like protein
MTPKEFDAIAVLISSREPAKSAARLVLIHGKGVTESAKEYGITRQSVSNTLKRFRSADKIIRTGYKIKSNSA